MSKKKIFGNNYYFSIDNHLHTLISFANGGALLAHNAPCLCPVSMFQIETSLFPCDADISQDGSVGCGITFLIR